MKYHIVVYGCQMKISDAERVSAVLESSKYKKTPEINEADLIVVVMCSVRQSAVDRVVGLIEKFKKIRKSNPGLKTVLTGCVLKKGRKILIEGFDHVIDIKDIKKLPKIIGENYEKNSGDYLDITPKYSSKFSANVPIMTGCNNFCAYCVVPYIRGREISRPSKEIISEIKKLIRQGFKEIWLLGQNVNSYKDTSTGSGQVINFPKLLKDVSEIPGNFWIRFTSPHPKDFSAELIEVMGMRGKITPYLNLPVQAGDDEILRRMNRPYTVAQYKSLAEKIRKEIPDVCISTDIIVGFPGETKKQFENSKKLFKDIKFDMAYISEYSPRPGTAASKMKDDVTHAEKSRRKYELNEVLKKTALENNQKYVGRTVEALITQKSHKGFYIGKTKEYKTINVKSDKNLIGKFIKAKITEATSWGISGKMI